MELKEYIRLALQDLPIKTKINFDIGIKVIKGKLFVETYGSNKIKFSITKTEE